MIYVKFYRPPRVEGEYKKFIYRSNLAKDFFEYQLRLALGKVDSRFNYRANIVRVSPSEIESLGLSDNIFDEIFAISRPKRLPYTPEVFFPSDEDIINALDKIKDGKVAMEYDYRVAQVIPTKTPAEYSNDTEYKSTFDHKEPKPSNTKYWIMGGSAILALAFVMMRKNKN